MWTHNCSARITPEKRLCSAKGKDLERLSFLGGHLDLTGTQGAGWEFQIADTGTVRRRKP